jgi:hypothetical protein
MAVGAGQFSMLHFPCYHRTAGVTPQDVAVAAEYLGVCPEDLVGRAQCCEVPPWLRNLGGGGQSRASKPAALDNFGFFWPRKENRAARRIIPSDAPPCGVLTLAFRAQILGV